MLICGGGCDAHIFVGLSSQDFETRVLNLHKDYAERWTNALSQSPFIVEKRIRTNLATNIIKAKRFYVSKTPS